MTVIDHSYNELNERIAILYANLPSGLLVSFIAGMALVLGFFENNVSTQEEKLIWFCLLLLCLSVRLWTYFSWKKKNNINSSSELMKFRIGAITTALLWSFYCLYFHSSFDIYEAASTMVVVSAMTGGAATILSGDKLISIAYTGVLLTPYSITLLVEDHSSYRILGGLGIAFFFIMCIGTLKSANFILASIKLKYEHEQLLRNLEKEVKKRTRKIIHLSETDGLTNLMNRKTFIDASQKMLMSGSAKTYALFFIDLNDFKELNDNYGHTVGDSFLVHLAGRLRKWASATDRICRWGGDEFVIFCEIREFEEIESKARKITDIINEKMHIENNPVRLSASIGIAVYPEHAKDINSLISCADIAMYKNKKVNRVDYFFFSHEIGEKVKRDYILGNRLKDAIANNELSIMFQPIYSNIDGFFIKAEALLRWQLDREIISPDVFIPLAEKNGEIINIGYWVLESSIKSAINLERAGIVISICVNVSVLQFKADLFVSNVFALLDSYNFPPERLHLELTESIFSGSNVQVIQSIELLRDKGIKISIDDFGTGYSSLSIIQKLRIDTVKIDKSFVLEINGNGLNIIKSVMVMSHGLGFEVVAEGVEEKSQLEILKANGVHYIQGYFFSRPLTEENLATFLTKNKNQNDYIQKLLSKF